MSVSVCKSVRLVLSLFSVFRKLSEDKEDILSSRDKSLASLASLESVPGLPGIIPR